MALTHEEVRKISALARLRFSPEEEGRLIHQLGAVVDYIDQLQGYETGEAGDAPLSQASHLREAREEDDRPHACMPRELFLANAPAQALGEFLLVPEVKGGGEDA